MSCFHHPRAMDPPLNPVESGRINLLVAEGMPISDVAATVGLSCRFVYKWVQRFLAHGMEGLTDKLGRGHRRVSPTPALAQSPAVSA